MKKTFIFGLMAAALGFTACSNDDDLNVINNTQKGMVLRATVEQPAETRATINDSETTWKFAFATDDNVSVTNSATAGTYYTFTNDGTDFKSEDAQTTATDATWYAYFPSNEVSLVDQSGTMTDVANKYALAGKTESATTGKDDLSITMSPKVAILKIHNNTGSINVNVKVSATEWVKGLTASEDGFTVAKETSKQTLLSATEKGIYYVAVPAGVQISVKDGDKVIKSTGTNGLAAGKYYELAIGSPESSTGSASATGITGGVNWVQLWEGGPKFAEYNVGATSVTDYGGYYAWGGKTDKGTDYNKGTGALSGDDDTATKLWGSNWCMPTKDELQGLLSNCTSEWTTVGGVNGHKFTGKGAYASNSVFLPAAGFYYSRFSYQGSNGYYWSSTPNGKNAYNLAFTSSRQEVKKAVYLEYGYSVRAVLKEAPATTGTAEATINGVKTNVNWVQLWAGGPKFADRNVDGTMTFTDAIATSFIWGSNWCTPSKADMEHLMTAAKGQTDEKVKCEYTQENSTWGFKFTGKEEGYTGNSVFFPAQDSNSRYGFADYWSGTANGSEAWYVYLCCYNGRWTSDWGSYGQGTGCLVRPVLKN